MVTSPGFSSRSTQQVVRQFPQRDEAAMDKPGWSNSKAVDEAEVPTPAAEAEAKVVDSSTVEDKAVKPATKKRPVRKS